MTLPAPRRTETLCQVFPVPVLKVIPRAGFTAGAAAPCPKGFKPIWPWVCVCDSCPGSSCRRERSGSLLVLGSTREKGFERHSPLLHLTERPRQLPLLAVG